MYESARKDSNEIVEEAIVKQRLLHAFVYLRQNYNHGKLLCNKALLVVASVLLAALVLLVVLVLLVSLTLALISLLTPMSIQAFLEHI